MNLQIGRDATGELRQEQSRVQQQGAAAYARTQAGGARAEGVHSAAAGAFRLDLQGSSRTDTILGEEKKGIDELVQEAGVTDAAAQKDFMVLASNTMSPEAYGELARDGYRPEQMEPDEIVDTVDQIKARMAEAGVVIRGYNDDLSAEQLAQITGSAAYAAELSRAFAEQGAPLTEETAREATELRETARQVTELSDGAKNYLVENGLRPTADQLYRAAHSANGIPQGGSAAYIQTGAYLGRTASPEGLSTPELRPQLERVIRRAGEEPTEERIATAERMLSQGVALTEENYLAMRKLDTLELPLSDAELADAAARAVADGLPVSAAEPGDSATLLEQAVAAKELIDSVDDAAVDAVIRQDLPLTVKNLAAQQAQLSQGEPSDHQPEENAQEATDRRVLTARRQVAEVRLTMTVEVNLRLLKRGVSIDTTELSRLVDDLKSMEKEMMQRMFEAKDDASAALRSSLFDETRQAVSELPGMPVSVVGDLLVRRSSVTTITLSEYTEVSRSTQAQYAAAGERYETMMTVPRADLGDTIRSAFDRADTLMRELGLEPTEENARAVRILGYNSMELTQENVDAVKAAYDTVSQITERMTPAATLQMIREGVNPMRLTMNELDRRLGQITDGIAPTGEKYSEYLVRLEERHAITSEEKESYIGIYRMLHQVGKRDGAAIGSLLKQGTELSFANLMTAVRSHRDRGLDVNVDDAFGGVESAVVNDIDAQIEAAYAAGSYYSAAEELREAADVPVSVYEELQRMSLPVTAENVTGLDGLRKERGGVFRDTREAARRLARAASETRAEEVSEEADAGDGAVSAAEAALEAALTDTLESFTSAESAQDAYARMTERMEQTITDAMEVSEAPIDVRQYSLMMKQLGVAGSLAREESYEIPMTLGGEDTTVNVRIVHEGRASADVEIHMETEALGHIRARFQGTAAGALQGYTVCEREESVVRLREREGVLRERFQREEIALGDMVFITSELAALNISAARTDEDNSSPDTATLYRAARAFLQVVGGIA